LYGIDFPSNDLKLALIEAAEGKVGTIADRVLLFCFDYDPDSGSYSFTIRNILKGLSGFMLLFMIIFIYSSTRSSRAKPTPANKEGIN
jgi:protein SCO1/2